MSAAARSRLLWVTLFTGVALLGGPSHRILPWLGIGAVDENERLVGLSVLNTTRDLGQTADRKQWEIIFPVHNTGTRRLVLNELDLQCGCSDRALRTIVVPPKQVIDLSVSLDTRFASGPVENVASFTTSDPNRPRLSLTVRAWVDAVSRPGEGHEDD